MKCIECQHVKSQDGNDLAKNEMLKNGFALCALEKKVYFHDVRTGGKIPSFITFNSLTYERDCKLFKRADDATIKKCAKWLAQVMVRLKSEVINGDRIYRQKMEMKRRK